jgi:hypothetical protein
MLCIMGAMPPVIESATHTRIAMPSSFTALCRIVTYATLFSPPHAK